MFHTSDNAFTFVDLPLAFIAHRRVILSEWPDKKAISAALATLQDLGAQQAEPKNDDFESDFQNIYFHLNGHRLRLCIEEYGAVSLWGPWSTVTALVSSIEERPCNPQPSE